MVLLLLQKQSHRCLVLSNVEARQMPYVVLLFWIIAEARELAHLQAAVTKIRHLTITRTQALIVT